METIQQFARRFWMKEVQSTGHTDITVNGITRAILADPTLTRQAVAYAVLRLRRSEIDLRVRTILINNREHSQSTLANELISYGLTLLNTRFGSKRLGDFHPVELSHYAQIIRESGQTMLIRASFTKAIAAACADPDKIVRDQLSAEQVEIIRARIVECCPSKEIAERVLFVG